jgi:HPt (histidine-containing phosphotransfer) domain-containing protein
MNEAQKDYLTKANINLDNAVNYTGDLETYHEILVDFGDNLDNQFQEIKNSINDLPNYAILAHALKSNARTLGFTILADAAYKHEMAGKENNAAFINEDIVNLENAVKNVKLFIDKYKSL